MSLQIHRVCYTHATFVLQLALIYKQLKKHLKKEKQLPINSVFDTFLKDQQTDPSDHLAEYYLAQQFTYGCKVAKDMNLVKRVLNICFEHILSLCLLVLLLCTYMQHVEVLLLTKDALDDYPNSPNLLYVTVYVELQSQGAGKC